MTTVIRVYWEGAPKDFGTGDVVGSAFREDTGESIGSHWSSNVGWLKHDLGVCPVDQENPHWRHKEYAEALGSWDFEVVLNESKGME